MLSDFEYCCHIRTYIRPSFCHITKRIPNRVVHMVAEERIYIPVAIYYLVDISVWKPFILQCSPKFAECPGV